ncbi:MAG TPA: hypothetical protein VMZ30_21825 [Pyrinomonadaceae bacterium]|nr:hypothetical protein [Pyrinomonadaceae bacterium]
MDGNQRHWLGLDLRVILQHAGGRDYAGRFIEEASKKHRLKTLPTVGVELAHALIHGPTADSRRIAANALGSLKSWKIDLLEIKPEDRAITQAFAHLLIDRGLLSENQCSEGEILAEASILGIQTLASDDLSLVNIPREKLNAAFSDRDLHPVQVISICQYLQDRNITWQN